jgi:serine/threonine protein kinase
MNTDFRQFTPKGNEEEDGGIHANRLVDDYYMERVLGKGSFGTSVLCNKQSENKKYVIKIINLKETSNPKFMYDLVMNEIFVLDILRTNCEKYIMCYNKTFIKDTLIHVVCEYLENFVTLHHIFPIDTTPESNETRDKMLATLFHNMFHGLQQLHEMNICHRDIKLDNILYNPITYDIKYIDFGLSVLFIDNVTRTISRVAGTPIYMYPSLYLTTEELTFDFLKKADYFSFGMTVFMMLSNGMTMFQKITGKDPRKTSAQKVIQFNSDLNQFSYYPELFDINAINTYILSYAMDHDLTPVNFIDILHMKQRQKRSWTEDENVDAETSNPTQKKQKISTDQVADANDVQVELLSPVPPLSTGEIRATGGTLSTGEIRATGGTIKYRKTKRRGTKKLR